MANSLFQSLWLWSKPMVESGSEEEPPPEPVPTFRFTGASVIGSSHSNPGRPGGKNNQDAWKVEDLGGGRLIGVVADGCSSCAHSEVGAFLGANLLAELLTEGMNSEGWDPERGPDWIQLRDELLDRLWKSVRSDSLAKETLLFTLVGFVVTPSCTWVFNFGDGVFAVNGELTEIGPFPDNAPPYLAYVQLGSPVLEGNPELRRFQVRHYPTREIETLLVGSDGVTDLVKAAEKNLPGKEKLVGPIDQIFDDPVFMKNPDKLRRWLTLVSLEYPHNDQIKLGLLPDDTTIVAVKVEWPEGAVSTEADESTVGTVGSADSTARGSITTPLPPETSPG